MISGDSRKFRETWQVWVSTWCISHVGGFVSSFVKTDTKKSFSAVAFSSSLMALRSAKKIFPKSSDRVII